LPTFKVAIVGAGPAGYFTAQALQNAQTDEMSFQIDTVKKFPTSHWEEEQFLGKIFKVI